jgi:hypothetical protein
MLRILPYLFLLPALQACSTVGDVPATPTSSTQGVTLVRTGKVVDVKPQLHGQIAVMFESGEVRRFDTDDASGFQIGDIVSVSENRGAVRISRQ